MRSTCCWSWVKKWSRSDIKKLWSSEGKMGGDFWSSEGQLRAQICIEEAMDIRFWGAGGRWGTKKRPREPQEAPDEARSHDPSALSMDYELSRSRWQPHKNFQELSWEPKWSSRRFRRAPQMLWGAQKTILRSTNVNVHKTVEKPKKIADYSRSEGQVGA